MREWPRRWTDCVKEATAVVWTCEEEKRKLYEQESVGDKDCRKKDERNTKEKMDRVHERRPLAEKRLKERT